MRKDNTKDIAELLIGLRGGCEYLKVLDSIISLLQLDEPKSRKTSTNGNHSVVLPDNPRPISCEEAASVFISLAEDAQLDNMRHDSVLCAWNLLRDYQGLKNLTDRRRKYLEDRQKCDPNKVPVPEIKKSSVDGCSHNENMACKDIAKFFITLDDPLKYIRAASRRYISRDPDAKGKYEIIYQLPSYMKEANKQRAESYGLPMSNDYFTGRAQILETIWNNFSHINSAAGCHRQVLCGVGGMGKTQTALKYAYDHFSSYSLIHWVDASTVSQTINCYKSFLKINGLFKDDATPDDICGSYIRYMESHSDWLIVYDNCDYCGVVDLNDFNDFMDRCIPKNLSSGHILITTRNKYLFKKDEIIDIDTIPEDDAISFLLRRTGSSDRPGAKALAERLGCFPLALELAGAYIYTTPGCGIPEYLSYLEKDTSVLERNAGIKNYRHTVKEILRITFDRIVEERACGEFSPYVEEVVRLCSFGAPHDIDLSAFRRLPCNILYLTIDDDDDIDVDTDPELVKTEARRGFPTVAKYCKNDLYLNDLKQVLVKYALLKEQENGLLSMHELQQEIMRDVTEVMDYYYNLYFVYGCYEWPITYSKRSMAELHSLYVDKYELQYLEKHLEDYNDVLDLHTGWVTYLTQKYDDVCNWGCDKEQQEQVLNDLRSKYDEMKKMYFGTEVRHRNFCFFMKFIISCGNCLEMLRETARIPFAEDIAKDMTIALYQQRLQFSMEEITYDGIETVLELFIDGVIPTLFSTELLRNYDTNLIPAMRFLSSLLNVYIRKNGDEYLEEEEKLLNEVIAAYEDGDPGKLSEQIRTWIAENTDILTNP